MYRKNLTWFGFNITQKQAVQIFTLSLIGIVFSLFILSTFVVSYLTSFMYYNPEYYPENYLVQMILSMSPFLILLLSVFLLSCYSAARCRKIAKYYSYHMFNPPKSENVPQYCQNAGHNFCKNCGEQF
ncbi:MAG: hypothetical protein EAX89_13060 [Candidatus Lokiarchaeota archaeon]|nr:hypothetical protein [Candidatus Lokiarchaeota archaeon]